jgi:drug/metabolite transporter (DMT)-like permease
MLNSAVPFTLFAYTALSMSAGFGSVLNSTVPLFGALVAWLWLKDHLSVLTWLGLLLGFVGVLILVWGRISFKPGGTGLAVLAALLATFLYGFSANYVKKMASGIPSLALAAGSMVTATLMLLPFAIAFWPSTPPDLKAWAAVLVLAFACTGLAYILYFRLITQVGPTRTITVTFLIPVFGMLWGWLFLSEPITLQMILGCGVILFGTALTTGVLNVPRVKSRP